MTETMTLFLAFIGLLILFALVGRAVDRYNRRREAERLTRRLTAQLEDIASVMGGALIPAFEQTTQTFQDFAAALTRKDAS